MKYGRDELKWIKNNTAENEKYAVKKFMAKKTPKTKNKKINSYKSTTPDKDSESYKWTLKTRSKLLKNQTPPEKEFYSVLDTLNIPYDKQYPFFVNKRIFFADAVFHKTHTIVEIDGDYHLKKSVAKRDADRTKHLNGIGYRVVRITNDEIYDITSFMTKISEYIPVNIPAYMYLVE